MDNTEEEKSNPKNNVVVIFFVHVFWFSLDGTPPLNSTPRSHNTLCRVRPFLFFELRCSYCFNPNTYEFKEELIDWDYKGFRLGLDKFIF